MAIDVTTINLGALQRPPEAPRCSPGITREGLGAEDLFSVSQGREITKRYSIP